MKLKAALTLSVLVNLILAWVFLTYPRTASKPQPALRQQDVQLAVPAGIEPHATTINHGDAPRVELRTTPISWQQVESSDYRQYLANLRAIGCPEKTIRDIVTADVNELFAERAAAITRTNQYRYWRREALTRTREQEEQLKQLLLQKQEVLRILGVEDSDPAQLAADYRRDTLLSRDAEIAFLPEAQREKVRETLFRGAQRGLTDGDDTEKMAQIERETEEQLQSLLSPEEFFEYELRASTDARQLSGTLDALELSEAEFRTVFSAWRDLKAHAQGTPEYQEARQRSEALLLDLLGEERFQRYLAGLRQWGYPAL